MTSNIFSGCMPALMTPCKADRSPDFDALVKKGKELIEAGMSAVVATRPSRIPSVMSTFSRSALTQALSVIPTSSARRAVRSWMPF